MGISKVIYNNQTLIDLTSDSVTADTLCKGAIAYGSNGEIINGTLELSSESEMVTGTVTPPSEVREVSLGVSLDIDSDYALMFFISPSLTSGAFVHAGGIVKYNGNTYNFAKYIKSTFKYSTEQWTVTNSSEGTIVQLPSIEFTTTTILGTTVYEYGYFGAYEYRWVFIGTLIRKKGPTNWVPLSIDTDGSIYNGTGYIEGYRLSSSGALKAQGNTVTTGFIKASKNDVIRMAGTSWYAPVGYNYFAIYDKDFNMLATINQNGENGNNLDRGWSYGGGSPIEPLNTYVYVEDEITRFAIAMKSGTDYVYIRISAYGLGENMIVTVNEEID